MEKLSRTLAIKMLQWKYMKTINQYCYIFNDTAQSFAIVLSMRNIPVSLTVLGTYYIARCGHLISGLLVRAEKLIQLLSW